MDYTTYIQPDAKLTKEDCFNAVQSPTTPINDVLGKPLQIVGIIFHEVELTNADTGEIATSPRIILIDKDNESYVAVSKTLYNAFQNLFAFFGNPETWGADGLPLVVKQVTKGSKRYYSLEVAKTAKK